MIKINKAGYIYVAITILIGFSAVNTGNNLVYIVTSALLSYMLVSGIFGKRNIYAIEVTVEYPQEIFAGSSNPVIARIRNKRRFMPAFLIRVSFCGQERLFPFIEPRSSLSHCFIFSTPARGRHRTADVRISSVSPFNLFTRYRSLPTKSEIVVYPRPQKCFLSESPTRQLRARGEVSSNFAGYDSDLLSIRNYVTGDPPKYISWKATAKTGQLKTKELSALELKNVIINFDRMDKGNREFTISCVTFTILKLYKSKIPVGLTIEGETMGPGLASAHRTRMLTKLALYDQT